MIAYTRPIIDFAMHQFGQECCFIQSGNSNFGKAAADKALCTLDKLLLMNQHYQLIFDFNVWDISNPPSLNQLKQLSTRHPYQPISEALMKEISSCKNLIHEKLRLITKYRQSESGCDEDARSNDDDNSQHERPPLRYASPHLGGKFLKNQKQEILR